MSTAPEPQNVTKLLRRLADGDRSAEEELLPGVYGELKRLAAAQLRSEKPGHTLQATALVHEVYLRMTNGKAPDWQSRLHFFAFAARLMRRILVDHARRRRSTKRGGEMQKLSFDDGLQISGEKSVMAEELDALLNRLAEIHPRRAQVVELRFFGGLTEEEIATLLGVCARTIKRDWVSTRAWLRREMDS